MRLLFICTTFPPRIGGAIGRNLGFVRHLTRQGWQATVLTTSGHDTRWSDPSPLGSLPRDVRVIRTWAPTYPSPERSSERAGQRERSVRTALRDVALEWVLIPDREAPWIPLAVRAARRELGPGDYDAVVSSGPPHSAHVVARLAIVGRDIPWIADLSDPWADNPYAGTRGRLRQGLDPWLEARVLARADAIVTPTAALTQRVRTRMPRSRAGLVTIPNGYDETEFADLETPRPAADLHVVHVGSFYASRSPHVFLEAVRRAIARAPRPLERLRVTFYGYADDASRREIFEAQRSLGVPVAYEPFLERRRALAEMLGAGALLLVTDAGMAGRELVPLKTFEYLRAGRPILALVPEGEARNLLRRCGGAFCAEPEDPDAVANAIVRLAENDLPAPPDQNCVPEFEMGRLTARLVRVLEEIRERP